MAAKYDAPVDRESAYELLNGREAQAAKDAEELARREKAEAEAAKARKAQTADPAPKPARAPARRLAADARRGCHQHLHAHGVARAYEIRVPRAVRRTKALAACAESSPRLVRGRTRSRSRSLWSPSRRMPPCRFPRQCGRQRSCAWTRAASANWSRCAGAFPSRARHPSSPITCTRGAKRSIPSRDSATRSANGAASSWSRPSTRASICRAARPSNG